MKITIITNPDSKKALENEVLDMKDTYDIESNVFILTESEISKLKFDKFLFTIEDDTEDFLSIARSAELSNQFEEIVICDTIPVARYLVSQLTDIPLLITLDFKLGKVSTIYKDTSELYFLMKTKFNNREVIGYTRYENSAVDEIGNQTKPLLELLTSYNDSVYDKLSFTGYTALANVFRDKIRLAKKTDENGKLLDELNAHVDLFYDDIISYKETEKMRSLKQPIIGDHFSIKKVKYFIELYARIDKPVSIFGETGTGKELVAQAIHWISPRGHGNIECVNCAAIPKEMLESELFGYMKGAFTGATSDKEGRIEKANKGTLFLDEIGDMAIELQAKLLRVISTGMVQRLGSTVEKKVDFKLITATSRDLDEEVATGKFNMALKRRILSAFPSVPPLRERKSDIPLLVKYFLTREKSNLLVSKEGLELLMSQDWPYNIGGLERLIIDAIVLFGTKPDLIIGTDQINYLLREMGLKKEKANPVVNSNKVTSQDYKDCVDVEPWLDRVEATLQADFFKSMPKVKTEIFAPHFISTKESKEGITRGSFSTDEVAPRKKCIIKLLKEQPNRWPTVIEKLNLTAPSRAKK